MRLARAPMLHFLLIGSALFALAHWMPASRTSVLVRDADVVRRDAEWTWQHGKQPDAATRVALADEVVDEAVLYRSAVDTGVADGDARLRERLLGFPRAEVVQRRHVTQLMRLAAEHLGTADMPSDADLAAYLGAHADAFAEPATLSLTQVYFADDRRGPALARDAQAAADVLRRGSVAAADAPGLGDAFVAGASLTGVSRDQLGRIFGADFAGAVWDAPVGVWVGPVASSYGLHLVRIVERTPGRVPTLAAVRSRVLQALLRERRIARRDERLRALRALYAARVDDAAAVR